MKQFLLIFYVLFFATGFMGGAALFLLELRMRSRILRPLLLFQILFLIGTGLIIAYFYGEGMPGGLDLLVGVTILTILNLLNALIYGIVIVLIRRLSSPKLRYTGLPLAGTIVAALVVVKSIANIPVFIGAGLGHLWATVLSGSPVWIIGGHLATAAAMFIFGIVLRGRLTALEPEAIRRLLRAYGLCSMIFAPIGLIEYGIQAAGLPWLSSISLDHFFYFTWNIISMSAAVRLFRPSKEGNLSLEEIPEEKAEAYGLSAREKEITLLIARGLANKEIAGELHISPATVRTHIYNLYQKTEARSRIEFLNKLKA